MTTVVIVQKDGLACIAADSLTSFGEMRLSATYAQAKSKIVKVGDAYLGLTGSTAHFNVLESYFKKTRRVFRLRNRHEIFEAWMKLHEDLKDKYFLNPKDDAADPYESTQLNALIASPHGLFAAFSLREVFEFSRFWAMGSGREYALGALHVLYDRPGGAREIAEAAIAAACEFDKSSGLPIEAYVIPQVERR